MSAVLWIAGGGTAILLVLIGLFVMMASASGWRLALRIWAFAAALTVTLVASAAAVAHGIANYP